jgi:thioredoxin 1
MIAPVVAQIAAEYAGRVAVGKLDVDANPETAQRLNVRSLPSLLIFRDGALVDTVVGAVPKRVLEQRIEQHLHAAHAG